MRIKGLFKKIVIVLLSLLVFSNSTITILASEKSSTTEVYSISDPGDKEKVLLDITRQLIEQNAMEHYYIYKKMIDDRFLLQGKSYVNPKNTQLEYNTLSSTAGVSGTYSFPYGGSVYYSNYLNTGCEVKQTYLDRYATSKAMDGALTQSILFWFVDAAISKFSWPFSLFLAFANGVNATVNKQITDGNGTMEVMYSNDYSDSATIKLYWKNFPSVYIYSGAIYYKR